LYIAVYSFGGIIEEEPSITNVSSDKNELIREMENYIRDNFDPEADDAKIFNAATGECVYVFDHEQPPLICCVCGEIVCCSAQRAHLEEHHPLAKNFSPEKAGDSFRSL
jgi:hypothetical protein